MIRKYFFFWVCTCCCFLLISCKKEEVDLAKGFIKYFGGIEVDDASEVQQTSDGGYIIIGTTSSKGNGGSDMYVIKTDASGNKQWEKTFGATLNDRGASVQQTNDGGYVFLGTYRYALGIDSNTTDVFVIKANDKGDTLWTMKYGDFSGISTNEEGVSIQQTSDGGYIIAGNTDVGTDGDMILIKITADGILTASGQHPAAAATGLDQAVNILQRQNGYVLSSYANGFNSPRIVFVENNLVANSNAILKEDFFEETLHHAGEVAITHDGEYILTGKTIDNDIFLIKFKDLISNPKTWFKTYGGGGEDIGKSVQIASDGGYIILGSTTSVGAGSKDIYLLKVDPSGDHVEWSKTFGGAGADVGKLIRKTSDGGYIILGTVEFGDDPSDQDNIICLIKVNEKGEVAN